MQKRVSQRFLFVLVLCLLGAKRVSAEEYEVLPPLPSTRGQIWISDGPSYIVGENRAFVNRFRLGLDYQFGSNLKFLLGWTILDDTSTGEKSASVGAVSRSGTGPNIGYFLIPDELQLTYTFLIEAVSGDRVSEDVTTYGHQLALAYQVYSNETIHVGVSASYTYLPKVSVPVYDLPSQSFMSATYPAAQIWSLSLICGAYFF